MFKISLVNMPFANLMLPSIALTQLKSVIESRFRDRVSVEILYVNQDFVQQLGMSFYRFFTDSAEAQNSGFGDWFFRKVAFPDVPDNSEKYFRRYFPYRSEDMDRFRQNALMKREQIEPFIEDLIKKYALDDASIIGFTSMFMQNVASFAMAKKIKECNPNVITIMGGANCETPMGQEIAKNVKSIDFVFSGPGLKSFPTFIEYCLQNETDKCHTIKGVFSKKNYIFQSTPDAIGEELDIDVPIDLNYDDFMEVMEQNFGGDDIKAILPFETSRGCWWGERAHCTFCGLNGLSMAYRAMKPELALKQFESLFKYAPKVAEFEAVDNILPKSYLQDVLPFIDTPQTSIIFYEVKADLSEQDVQVLAKARVKLIQPGIESLATSTLKLMKKGTSAFQNIMLLKNCAIYDVQPSWNLLIGFPGEGEEVYKKYLTDLDLLVHLPPPAGVFPVRFDRFSPYFVKADEYGLKLRPLDYYALTYPFDKQSLSNLAYYFGDINFGAAYVVTMAKWINKLKEKVSLWVARHSSKRESVPPRLHFAEKDGKTIVYDSRSGKAIEQEVCEAGVRILEALEKPKRLSDLAKAYDDLPDVDFERAFESLRQKGLVFQEGDKYINLVLPKAAP